MDTVVVAREASHVCYKANVPTVSATCVLIRYQLALHAPNGNPHE
jgi:hypothetical protein